MKKKKKKKRRKKENGITFGNKQFFVMQAIEVISACAAFLVPMSLMQGRRVC